MKIRLRHDLGVCEGYLSAKAGDVIEVAESSAMRYIKLGYAEAVTKGQAPVVETAVAQEKSVETATVPDAPLNVPKPLDEDDEGSPKPGAPRNTPRRK